MKDTIKKLGGQDETKIQEIHSPSDGEANQEEQKETDAPEITVESNKAVEIDADMLNCSIQETETVIIFDLCALSEIATFKSVVLGVSELDCALFVLMLISLINPGTLIVFKTKCRNSKMMTKEQ